MIKTLNLGFGLGGGRFAASLAKKTTKDGSGSNSIIMNISTSELDMMNNIISKGDKIVIGNVDGGAGRDRAFSIDVFTSKFDYVSLIEKVKKRVISEEIDLVTIAFSTGGGTGSGCGPVFTNMLLQAIEQKVTDRKVRVIGIALMPAFNEGIGVFRNTLLSINDINKIINKHDGHFIIVENGNNSGGSFTERRDFVNENSTTLISEYLNGNENHSEMGVLDMSDRRMGFSFPGLHAFARLRECDVVKSTFIEPGSNHCKTMLAVVPEENADLYEANLSKGVNLDHKIGYTKAAEGIVGWHGFFNLEEITIRYRKRFDQLKTIDMKGDNDTETNSLKDLFSEVYDYNVKKRSYNEEEATGIDVTKESNDTSLSDIADSFKNFEI